MLTDDEIYELFSAYKDDEEYSVVAELCTRVLASEARATVLEDALPKALDGLSWSQHHLREADMKSTAVETALEAVRKALEGK